MGAVPLPVPDCSPLPYPVPCTADGVLLMIMLLRRTAVVTLVADLGWLIVLVGLVQGAH